MKTPIIALFALAFMLSITSILLAQPGPPGPPGDPPQVPIDGGLGLLAAAGGAYALKKLKDRRSSDSM